MSDENQIDLNNAVIIAVDPINSKATVRSPENGRDLTENDMLMYGLFHVLTNADADHQIWQIIDNGVEEYLAKVMQEKGMSPEDLEKLVSGEEGGKSNEDT